MKRIYAKLKFFNWFGGAHSWEILGGFLRLFNNAGRKLATQEVVKSLEDDIEEYEAEDNYDKVLKKNVCDFSIIQKI